MKSISRGLVIAGWLCSIAFALTFVLGFLLSHWLFVVSALCLICFIVLQRSVFRCPSCGSRENLDRITYAMTHEYHCRTCGNIISVKDEPKAEN